MKAKGLKQGTFNKKNVAHTNECILQAMHTTHESLKAVENLVQHWNNQDVIEARQAKQLRKRAKVTKDEPLPPASIAKALRDEDRAEAHKWLDSIHAEWDGLCELGVLDHNYTADQLRENGITTKPIPLSR